MLKALYYGFKGYLKEKGSSDAVEEVGIPAWQFNQMRDRSIDLIKQGTDDHLLFQHKAGLEYNRWVEAGKRLYSGGNQPTLEEISKALNLEPGTVFLLAMAQ